jgi:hypothetical protein
MKLAAAVLVTAIFAFCAESDAPAPWKDKPVAAWTAQDATRLLTNSPWCRKVPTTLLRLQSEDERRAGGNMGRPHGVGYDHIDDSPDPGATQLFLKSRSKDGLGALGTVVQLRWETALPVQAAEMKVSVTEPPTPDGDFFVLAVYGIPGRYFNGEPATLGEPLKALAALKREGKKDIRPIRVEVFQREQDLVIAYLFARSEEITKNDKYLQFEAQIGRFFLQEVFDVTEMHFQGKLEM